MNEQEAFQVLTLASLRDNRTVTRAHAQAWAADLRDVAYEDAEQAVTRHYAESTDWMMPAHVRSLSRIFRDERRRVQHEQRRAIENASAEAEWEAEKAFRAAHGISRLEAAMRGAL